MGEQNNFGIKDQYGPIIQGLFYARSKNNENCPF
jgi:hypothetical protein